MLLVVLILRTYANLPHFLGVLKSCYSGICRKNLSLAGIICEKYYALNVVSDSFSKLLDYCRGHCHCVVLVVRLNIFCLHM